jgi:riboflavin kinase / FMN adenylyltransferase
VTIHHYYNNLPFIKNPVVTIGSFDGVHLAHQKIIEQVKQIAQSTDGQSVIITFYPHPRTVLPNADGLDLRLLQTLDERLEALEKAGIDHVIIIPFTAEFSNISSEAFTEKVLVDGLKTKKLVIGYDHRFGKDRTGGFEFLKSNEARFGFEVIEIERQKVDNQTISSSKIRKALLDGEILVANELLGRNFSMEGIVVKGKQLGRTIGFPTANIRIEEKQKIVPRDGVYVVKATVNNQTYGGMLNIGFRPTVGGLDRTIETNIFEFNEEIYDQKLKLEIIDFIRFEKKFASIDELKNQLHQDQVSALAKLDIKI